MIGVLGSSFHPRLASSMTSRQMFRVSCGAHQRCQQTGKNKQRAGSVRRRQTYVYAAVLTALKGLEAERVQLARDGKRHPTRKGECPSLRHIRELEDEGQRARPPRTDRRSAEAAVTESCHAPTVLRTSITSQVSHTGTIICGGRRSVRLPEPAPLAADRPSI